MAETSAEALRMAKIETDDTGKCFLVNGLGQYFRCSPTEALLARTLVDVLQRVESVRLTQEELIENGFRPRIY